MKLNPAESKYELLLKKSGLYNTAQRRIILETITRLRNKHSSFSEITAIAKRKDPTIGRVTVYRTLQLLAKQDVISVYTDTKGTTRYELPANPHIHITCDICGKVVEATEKAIEKISKQLLTEQGFTGEMKSIQITGRCRSCNTA